MIPAKTVAVRDRPSSTDGRTSAARRRLVASFAMALLATGCGRTTAADPSSATRDTDRAALEACRAALASQMGLAATDLVIRDVTRSEAGIDVRVTVDGAAAPWECRTDPKGEIQAVTFIGIEADD